MPRFPLPSIRELAREFRRISANVDVQDENGCEVRLQVTEGGWAVHFGDSSYDTDHRGFWGCGSVPGVHLGRHIRFDSQYLAREMLSQVREQIAIEPDATCNGHPAGAHDPMGQTVYCDGTCAKGGVA